MTFHVSQTDIVSVPAIKWRPIYHPENVTIFNPYFYNATNSSTTITPTYLKAHYLQYPVTQTGTINVQGTLSNQNSSTNQVYGYNSTSSGANNLQTVLMDIIL